ncbi:hypothetical protein PBI_KAMPE_93 [Gordonia phage Kampe]|uniref:Uncharacterized protein n=3 Tax=Gordonia phage Orchid TaxID=1838075 RepID=A0A166YGM4_9CAUD|nr:hypothetical protein BH761_gp092 [Gordonia phage Orchid]ANA87327.1 hypothetical protein PBI_PATRICKSTAR_93 [Gordonia phage PatrickStar]ANA87438.1 hypothetical protein PBI_ORCHID_92 [Gordonia phage Orchid]ANA87553.1 hypothetical protein PBI_KAMPE_93 [Gordonia phage Kampe]
MGRQTLKSHGHNFVDHLQKHWGKKGTATYPLVFRDADTDKEYQFTGMVITSEDDKTVIYIKEIP